MQFGKKKNIASKVINFHIAILTQIIDSLEVVIFLEIPYSILQFVKKDHIQHITSFDFC